MKGNRWCGSFGLVVKVMAKKIADGYRWGGSPSAMEAASARFAAATIQREHLI